MTTKFSGDPRLDPGREKGHSWGKWQNWKSVDYLLVLYQCEFYDLCYLYSICTMVTLLGEGVWELCTTFATWVDLMLFQN